MSDRTSTYLPDPSSAPSTTEERPIAPGRVTRTARIARRAAPGASAAPAAGAPSALDRASGDGGAPLPDDVRGRFERSLGADLSAVRVHTGADSAAAAASIGARAYTLGNDVHFGDGEYAPQDPFGLHLLAHEVAHTQQQAGAAPAAQAKLEVSVVGEPTEVEADRAADAMVRGAPAQVSSGAGARLSRQPGPPVPVDYDSGMQPMPEITISPLGTVAGNVQFAGKLEVSLGVGPATAPPASSGGAPDGGGDHGPEATELVRRYTREVVWPRESKNLAVKNVQAHFADAQAMPAPGAAAQATVECELVNGDHAAATISVTGLEETTDGLPFTIGADVSMDVQSNHTLPAVQNAAFGGGKLNGTLAMGAQYTIRLGRDTLVGAFQKAQGPNPQWTAKDNEKQAAFEARAQAASAAMDAAGHTQSGTSKVAGQAPAASGTLPGWFMALQTKLQATDQWDTPEETAQAVLREYLVWYMKARHGGNAASVGTVLAYLGRSSRNDAAATKAGMKGTSHYGGGKGMPNWCTSTSTTAVVDGLRELGYEALDGKQGLITRLQRLKGKQGGVYGEGAYAAPLLPGDMVMYFFQGAQYGGHTVTVVEDMGDSFMHVSGNTGAVSGVGASVAQRMKTAPRGFNLTTATTSATAADRTNATNHIASVDFGGSVLVYSIVHYGQIFLELGQLATIDPDTQGDLEKQIMAKYNLAKIK